MDKIKIIWISDHALSTSGVGTQSRFLIEGLLKTNSYKVLHLGGALRHENYDVIQVTPDFIIKPIDGFGDPNLIRQLLVTERPDVIMLFNDPRFFNHIWHIEDEIHQICPIAYNHLWDSHPWPVFNKPMYDCVDLVNCINWPTYEFVKEWCPDRSGYVPHAVPETLYKPLPKDEVDEFSKLLYGEEKANWFKVGWVARNAHRKMPNDAVVGFKKFLSRLERDHGRNDALLVMHTDPRDSEGPNLIEIVESLGLKNNVVFSKDRIDFDMMVKLYNSFDVLMNNSRAEGFGLPVLEAKMCGVPVIATATGGLFRQVVDHESSDRFGVLMMPDATMTVGSQSVPYIDEHIVDASSIADAITKMWMIGPNERKQMGDKARKHALKNYRMDYMISKWDHDLKKLVSEWRAGYKRIPRITVTTL